MPNTFRIDTRRVHIPASDERPRKINVGNGSEITVLPAAPEKDGKGKSYKTGESVTIEKGVFVTSSGTTELTIEDLRGVTELRSTYADNYEPKAKSTKKASTKKASSKKSKSSGGKKKS